MKAYEAFSSWVSAVMAGLPCGGLARPSSGPSQPGLRPGGEPGTDEDHRSPDRPPDRTRLGAVPAVAHSLRDLPLLVGTYLADVHVIQQHLASPPFVGIHSSSSSVSSSTSSSRERPV